MFGQRKNVALVADVCARYCHMQARKINDCRPKKLAVMRRVVDCKRERLRDAGRRKCWGIEHSDFMRSDFQIASKIKASLPSCIRSRDHHLIK